MRPDDRLQLDPKVHDLSVTVVSILQRRELPYASNKYPIGFMTDYSTAHHLVDCGEENRHNSRRGGIAYGHVMFLRIRNMVDPVSRGDLVSDFDPDYPPLCHACDDTMRQGGIVLWCHNGQGMEAPVAAALGKLDAFNLFDPFWMDPEYDIWYNLLNCGLALPASTGTDWFICSNNRVYVQTDQEFTYDNWLKGLQAGRTFITNGPALFLKVDDTMPGGRIESPNGQPRKVSGQIAWDSHYPINRIELVHNGGVMQSKTFDESDDQQHGAWRLTSESRPMAGSRHALMVMHATVLLKRFTRIQAPSTSAQDALTASPKNLRDSLYAQLMIQLNGYVGPASLQQMHNEMRFCICLMKDGEFMQTWQETRRGWVAHPAAVGLPNP